MVEEVAYVAWQSASDSFWPYGRSYYWKSHMLRDLADDLIDVIADFGSRLPTPLCMIVLEWYHGAYSRVEPRATAFWHRDARFQLIAAGGWDDPAEQEPIMRWLRDFHDATRRFSTAGDFLNFNSEDGVDHNARVRAGYGGNYERLAAIKARYDPTNLFRMNNNIPPATRAS
jgi:hypothetical protein